MLQDPGNDFIPSYIVVDGDNKQTVWNIFCVPLDLSEDYFNLQFYFANSNTQKHFWVGQGSFTASFNRIRVKTVQKNIKFFKVPQ